MSFAAVVPVRNEEHSIIKVIDNLLEIEVDHIIPVINGCKDKSEDLIKSINNKAITPISFHQSLGIDVPRAIGACSAYYKGAEGVLFVDGDMDGDIADRLNELKDCIITKEHDLALTNCYTKGSLLQISPLAKCLLETRKELNIGLGIYDKIGSASPTHGPHAISRRLMKTVPFRELSIPPVELALAVKSGLSLGLGTAIPHEELGSPQRDPAHVHLVSLTIMGDCIEAINAYHGKKRTRNKNGLDYTGYHQERRFDILD
ncbi:MAG TPA: glycosyltransferase family 2 protein, partial [Clostridia bacterium]|nr:glycosyltransferase family 2 protein [Clostridia bacterium]